MQHEIARTLLRNVHGKVQDLIRGAVATADENLRLARLLERAVDVGDYQTLTKLGVITAKEERRIEEARSVLRG